jgi:hypothetical protein
MNTNTLVQKLWNYCKVLRDDGHELWRLRRTFTYLLFLKMVDERAAAEQLGQHRAGRLFVDNGKRHLVDVCWPIRHWARRRCPGITRAARPFVFGLHALRVVEDQQAALEQFKLRRKTRSHRQSLRRASADGHAHLLMQGASPVES